jgi:accessory gene regulator B
MSAIIKTITKRWSEAGIIDQSDEDICEYGLELLLHTILNIAAVSITAALLGKLTESLAMLTVILPLQSSGGGYHAKTHLRCFLIMYIGWWVVAYLVLPFVTIAAAIVVSFAALPVVFKLAPVPHENVPMSDAQRLKMKKFARLTAAAGVAASITLTTLVSARIGSAMSVALGVVAFSMLAALLKRRLAERNNNHST